MRAPALSRARPAKARGHRAGIVAAALALSLSALGGCASIPESPEPPVPPPEAVAYDFPFNNPWVATVVGTPEAMRAVLPEPADWERGVVVPFPERETPEGFWYHDGLTYTLIRQPQRAPLAFVIAATGADDRARLMLALGRTLYAAGLHVVLLPSPTHPNFIVTASTTHLPGHAGQDAVDLYRAMRLIRDQLAGRIEIAGYHLAGYSLGAWHAAFTAHLDERERAFGFDRVLLINPPLSLRRSIGVIDRLLIQYLPGGIDGLGAFLDEAVAALAAAFETIDPLDFEVDDPALALYAELDPDDDQLAAVIGLAFRLAAANLIFTSDVMSRTGYIFPRDKPFLSTTPLGDYLAVSLRTSLVDYFEDVFAPYHLARDLDLRYQDLVRDASLTSIGGYLAARPALGVLANRDDVILAPGDIEELRRLFGERARIYPNGGHLGNLEHRAVVAAIVDFFRR